MKLNIQLFAHTNETANYDLPQFVGTDKPTWLGDFNEAMADIDAGMHENASDIASMQTDVATATATASQASQDVASLTSTVNTLSGNVTTATTTANNAQQTANSALNVANTKVSTSDLLDLVYPVGSIYLSVGSTAPSTLFGGTWQQIKDTFLLACGDIYQAGSTGGEAKHTLTEEEMPSHMHDIVNKEGLGDKGLCASNSSDGTNGYNWSFADTSNDETNNRSGLFAAAYTGGGLSHNNMPPYFAVYVWKRTE